MKKTEDHVVSDIVEYVTDAVLSRTLLQKCTGDITATSLVAGQTQSVRTFPHDCFIQIIDGSAELVINCDKYNLTLGNGIIIPAHHSHSFRAVVAFKMLTTVIKTGYSD